MNIKHILLSEIEKWSEKYQFSFQFWGEGNNNLYIYKDDVELHSTGGWLTIEDALISALEYIYRINRTPKNNRVC